MKSLTQAMAAFAPDLPLAVAYSGGADSTALLLACVRRWPEQVLAIHINHGLQAAAAGFEAHCRQRCETLDVPLVVVSVEAHGRSGESPEDAARRARYRALQAVAHEQTLDGKAVRSVLLAQHAQDQAETLLLALSRGAGLPGLSAMPAQWTHGGLSWHRPLLEVDPLELRTWLEEEGVSWVEDPSNQDTQLTRNRIRHLLLPALALAFPSFLDTFSRSARHAAQGQALLQTLAQQDLAVCGQPPRLEALRQLQPARQANALRHWLRVDHQCAPTEAQLDELLRQTARCLTRGHDIRIRVGPGMVLREGPKLAFRRNEGL